MQLLKRLLKLLRSENPVQSDPSTPGSTPTTPTTKLTGIKKHALKIAITIAAALIGMLSQKYLGEPEQVPVPVLVPGPAAAEPMFDEPVPIDYEGCSYHGHDHGDAIEANGKPWPVQRITWGCDYSTARGLNPPLSDTSIQSAIKTAWGWWAEGLDLEFVEVPYSSAMIPIRFERIDGAAGVLAEAYLADGTTRPKPMRLDASERWNATGPSANQISLPAVLCHEGGHSLGLGHDDKNAPAVMKPTYTKDLPREQPRDIDRAVAMGYRRRPPQPGDGSRPGGTATVIDFPVSAKASDLIDALKKAGYGVTPPAKPLKAPEPIRLDPADDTDGTVVEVRILPERDE